MAKTKSQISLEFILLISFMLFFFIVFFGVVQYRMAEAMHDKETELLATAAEYVKNEINLAYTAEDGYIRSFVIPENIAGKKYSFEFFKNAKASDTGFDVFDGFGLKFENQDISVFAGTAFLSAAINTKPNIIFGENTIQKINGRVILN